MTPTSVSDVHSPRHRHGIINSQAGQSSPSIAKAPPLYPLPFGTLSPRLSQNGYLEDQTSSASPSAIFSNFDSESLPCTPAAAALGREEESSSSETGVWSGWPENAAGEADSSGGRSNKMHSRSETEEGPNKDYPEELLSFCSNDNHNHVKIVEMGDGKESRAPMETATRQRQRHAETHTPPVTTTCTAYDYDHLHGKSRPHPFTCSSGSYAAAAAHSIMNGTCVKDEEPVHGASGHEHPSCCRRLDDQACGISQDSNSQSLSKSDYISPSTGARTSAAHPAYSGSPAGFTNEAPTLYDRRQQMQFQQRQEQQQQQAQSKHRPSLSFNNSASYSLSSAAASSSGLVTAPPTRGLFEDYPAAVGAAAVDKWGINRERDNLNPISPQLRDEQAYSRLSQAPSVTIASPSSSPSPSPLVTSPRTSSLYGRIVVSSPTIQAAAQPSNLSKQQSTSSRLSVNGALTAAHPPTASSSAVRASSPLRIITTPLPVISDPDSGGTEVPSAQGAKLSSSSSSSSVSEPHRDCGAASTHLSANHPHMHQSQSASTSASSSYSSSSLPSCDELPTPTASPYSSSYTTSSYPSSIPSTAGSSYPASATYSLPRSACNSAIAEEGNALQLSQESGKQHKCPHPCDTMQENIDYNNRMTNIGRKRSATSRTSRYSDFASLNISNYEWFNQVCPPSDRPPLLRSVSEDTPGRHSPSNATKGPSGSEKSLVEAAISGRMQYHSQHPHTGGEICGQQENRYDSLPMGQIALTTPNLNKGNPTQSKTQDDEKEIILSPAPPSSSDRTSYRNASASISSQSSISTAASSKRSSWSSPLAGMETLPSHQPLPSSLFTSSGRNTPTTQSQPTTSQISSSSTFKPSHSASYSVGAAIPLRRVVPNVYERSAAAISSDRRSALTSIASSNSAPPSNIGQNDTTIDLENGDLLASFDPAVAEAIRKAAATVRSHTGGNGGDDTGAGGRRASLYGQQQVVIVNNQAQSTAVNMSNMQNSLMGACGNGYFGNAIRAKVSSLLTLYRMRNVVIADLLPLQQALEILDELLPSTASETEDEEVIGIAEYGSLNSLSSSLVPSITSHFNAASAASESGGRPNFSVTYSDGPGADFRSLMRQVDSNSYEYPHHHLNSQVYSSFAARPFAAQIVPPRSVTVGISLMDLHCRRTPPLNGLSAAAAAHNELQAFLNTRAQEIKKGGLLVLAFIQRQEDESTAAVAAGRSKRAGDQDSPNEPNFTSPTIKSIHEPPSGLNMKGGLAFSSGLSPFPPASASESHSQSLSSSLDSSMSTASWSSSSSSSMSRRRSESSPCRPFFKTDQATRRNDIWSTIPSLLAPCIQRLVSTGLIKSDTASHLLTVSWIGFCAMIFC